MENSYRVTCVKSTYDPESNSYWSGLIVKFSGKDRHYFYQLIKKKVIDWGVFNLACTNLSRFDLHYLRDVSESESGEQFYQNLLISDQLEEFENKLVNHLLTAVEEILSS